MNRVFVSVLFLGPAVASQGGPMSSFAQAMSTPGMGQPILLKLPGDQTGNPPIQVPPGIPWVPDYNLQSMFGVRAQDVDLDAMSTGNDWFHVTENEVRPPPDTWIAMAFSVDRHAQGLPGSTIAQRALQPAGPGADLRTFYFEGSSGIGDLVGQSLMPTTAEQAGFDGGTLQEVDAIDLFLPLIIMNGGQSSMFAPYTTDFYFSVTTASAQQLGSSFFGGLQPSGAHVLHMEWTPAGSSGSWSEPAVHRRADQLGLQLTDEVDALGVSGDGVHVVFSTKEPAAAPLLLPGLAAVVRQGGNSIPPGIRITTGDDLDAFCAFDPEIDVYDYWLGLPMDVVDLSSEMKLSIARRKLPGVLDHDLIEIMVSGWGTATPDNGTMVFEHDMGTGWAPLWSEMRGEQQDVFGTSVQAYSPPGLMIDLKLRARFVPASQSLQAASYAVGIRI